MENMVTGKNYYVKEVPRKTTDPIVKRLHYSGKVVSNSKLSLGVFDKNNDNIVGVLQFGYPTNGYKTSSKFHNSERMYELNRMVMEDEEPRNSESQAISLSIKYLKRFTDIDFILSFSDGKEDNFGYIYQSSNWQYWGYLKSSSFYRLDDDIVHSITLWHRYKEKHPLREEKTTLEIASMYHNNISQIYSKQYVYLYSLRRNIKFNIAHKPYPKMGIDSGLIKEVILYENGIKQKKGK